MNKNPDRQAGFAFLHPQVQIARGPQGQKWLFSSFPTLPHVGTLNLWQDMPDKI